MESRARLAVSVAAATLVLLMSADALALYPESMGRDFWTAVPRDGIGSVTMMISSSVDTTATVEAPGAGFSVTVAVPALGTSYVAIPSSLGMPNDETVRPWGIHVSSRDPVAVHMLLVAGASDDGYLVPPTCTFGREYIAATYAVTDGTGAASMALFAVVATENGTSVRIRPSTEVVTAASTHPANVPYTVNLSRGDVYLLRSEAMMGLPYFDPTGTVISSNRRVTVISGSAASPVPQFSCCADQFYEQLLPVQQWGKEFITCPVPTRPGPDLFRIVASQDGTNVWRNGILKATLNRGQFFEEIHDEPSVVTADKPVEVVQFSTGADYDGTPGKYADPYMSLVPATSRYADDYLVPSGTPGGPFLGNHVMVTAPASATGLVCVDGVPIPAGSFVPVPGTAYSVVTAAVSGGYHRVSGPAPFGLSLAGFCYYGSYGYPGGMRLDCLEEAAGGDGEEPVHVYPSPFRPRKAVGGTLKFDGLPDGSKVYIYAVTGREVRALEGVEQRRLEWDGRNAEGTPAAAGIYLYLVEVPSGGGTRRIHGKIGLIR